jgi:tetratricopeptide (TPR) repeat protein
MRWPIVLLVVVVGCASAPPAAPVTIASHVTHEPEETGPTQPARYWVREAWRHQDRREPEPATLCARVGLRCDDATAIDVLNCANVLLEAEELDEAAGAYERVIALDPRSAVAVWNLALIRFDQKRWADAISLLERARASEELKPAARAKVDVYLERARASAR